MTDELRLEIRLQVDSEPLPEPSVERLVWRRGDKYEHRPKRGDWMVIWRHGAHVVFDSRWVSLELRTERGARWIAALVRTAIDAGVFTPPKGANVAPSHRAPIVWTRQGAPDFDDDSFCRHGPYGGHVEWTNGPQGKGGEYYVGVWCESPTPGGFADFHWTEVLGHVHMRSADAGRFLAELVIDVATAGCRIPAMRAAQD